MFYCDLIVRGQYILPMDGKQTIIKNGFVAVDKGKIKAVGKKEELSQWQAAQTIGSDKSLVLPGLVNTHTHAAMVGFRGLADDLPLDKWLNDHIWPAEAKFVTPEFIKKATRLACLEMIKAGVTCFSDMYFFTGQAIEAVQEAGMRAVIGEGILDFPTPSAKTPQQALDRTLRLAQDFSRHSLIKIALAPHSAYLCSPDLLKKIARAAEEKKLLIHIHISETKKEVEEAKKKFGLTPPAYLDKYGILSARTVAAHSVWLEDKDFDLYAKRGVKVSHNPSSNLKLGSGIMDLNKMLAKKITVSLGTDGAASNNTLDLFSEMRLAALLPKGLKCQADLVSAGQVVSLAVRGGAEALDWGNEIGQLTPGFSADLITIDLDKPHLSPIYNPYSHLVYAVRACDVEDVVVAGKIIMRGRKVLTLDEEKVIKEMRAVI